MVLDKQTQTSCIYVLVCVACALTLLDGTNAATNRQGKPTPHKESEVAQEHFKKAKDAYYAGKYSIAEQELKRVLSFEKESPDAHLLLGMAYWQEGKGKEAVGQINSALQYRPDYPEAHYYLSVIYWRTGNRARAHENIDLAISEGAHSFDAYYLRGQIDLADARYNEAVESFEEAARLLAPNDTSLTRLREQIDAVKHVKEFKSLELNPTYVRPVLLNLPMPHYTEKAQKEKVQGSVRVAVLVSEEGKIISAVVLLGLGYGLDEEAVKAVRQLRFKPATKNGQPVSFWKTVEVEFRLRLR